MLFSTSTRKKYLDLTVNPQRRLGLVKTLLKERPSTSLFERELAEISENIVWDWEDWVAMLVDEDHVVTCDDGSFLPNVRSLWGVNWSGMSFEQANRSDIIPLRHARPPLSKKPREHTRSGARRGRTGRRWKSTQQISEPGENNIRLRESI